MRRVLTLAAALVACLGAAACTSSSSPSSSSSSSGPSASPSSSATTASRGTAVAPARLAARLQRGLAGVRSVHLNLATQVVGSPTIRGAGDVTLRGGAISTADLTESLPGGLGSVRIIVADGKTYARLPAGLVKQDKPWQVLSGSSSQPLAAQLASTVDSLLSVASPTTAITFVRAAAGVRDLGAATVGGTAVRHYLVNISAAKLSTLPGGLSAGSAPTVPVDMYVAATGRPVRLAGSLELDGARVAPTVTLTRYDEPTSISVPPESQVAS